MSAGCSVLACFGSFGDFLELRLCILGQPLGKLFNDFLMSGIVGQVVEFVLISPVIIEFLGAVFVSDQSPVSSTDGVIAEIGRGDSWPVTRCRGVVQLGNEGNAFEVGILRSLAQFDESGVDVDQTGGFCAGITRLDTGSGNKERDARGFFP